MIVVLVLACMGALMCRMNFQLAAMGDGSGSARIKLIALIVSLNLLTVTPATFSALKRNSLGDIFNDDDINIKELPTGRKVILPSKPVFLEKHGIEGINYSLDNRSRPFIYCDVCVNFVLIF
ncbi:unnamed protein product [Gongylonema pulchrum]|uniref:Neur_chan_memb domain-containing protein n=1 Tax=Gongylonema pulchrum TaxID=637853 RepID=A0A183DIC4_9BILA|nr:unnamed protein product [Gongylonema pulchrum]